MFRFVLSFEAAILVAVLMTVRGTLGFDESCSAESGEKCCTVADFETRRVGERAPAVANMVPQRANRRKLSLANVTIDFEGVAFLEPFDDYYDGGLGGVDKDFGVYFSSNGIAYIESSSSLVFQYEPSPVTALYQNDANPVFVNVPEGFDTKFSFHYATYAGSGSYSLYSDLDGGGNQLASGNLTALGSNSSEQKASIWKKIDVAFPDTAKSVAFNLDNYIFVDDITFASNQAPTARCIQNAALIADSSTCQATPSKEDMISAIDNGSSDPDSNTFTYSFDKQGPFNIGSKTMITMTLDDGLVNGKSTCTTTVTVIETDGDGICPDVCPNTLPGQIVFPAGSVLAGCSVADLCPCQSCADGKKTPKGVPSRAGYRGCVAKKADDLRKAGVVSKRMKDLIVKDLTTNTACCL